MDVEKRKLVVCPHCHEQIMIRFGVQVLDAEVPPSPDENKNKANWTDGLNEKEIQIVEEAIATGIFSPFEQTVRRAKGGQVPKSFERFFLVVLKTATPVSVPAFALNYFRKEFRGARMEFWSAQGIGVVLADGVIRMFVPLDYVKGKAVRSASGSNGIKARLAVDEEDLSNWVRTRFGYVDGKGAFFQHMQKRSIGEFGLPRI